MREKALKHVNYLPSTKTQMDTVSSKGWWLEDKNNRAERRVNVGLFDLPHLTHFYSMFAQGVNKKQFGNFVFSAN